MRSNGSRAISDFACFSRRSSVAAKSCGSTPSTTTSCLSAFSTSAMPKAIGECSIAILASAGRTSV